MIYLKLCDFKNDKKLLDNIDFYEITEDCYFIIKEDRLLSIEGTEKFIIIDGFKIISEPEEVLVRKRNKFNVFHNTNIIHFYIIKSNDPNILRDLYCRYMSLSHEDFENELTDFYKINESDFYNGKYKWFIEISDIDDIYQKFEESLNIKFEMNDIYDKIKDLDYEILK